MNSAPLIRAAGGCHGRPHSGSRSPRSRPGRAGFTLVEVILAIGIAIGLLVVALYFYGQAADLRSRLLEESDRIASMRLAFDRFAADLRAAYAQPQIGFTGEAASMRFVVAGLPARSVFSMEKWSKPDLLESDLHLVSYSTVSSMEGTNVIVAGLGRTETALLDAPAVGTTTNAAVGGGTPGDAGRAASVGPWLDSVRFVQFFYWDGAGWADHWDSPSLPAGVEIDLGLDPLPSGTDPLDYPYELFRRAIYLPGSRGNEEAPETFARGAAASGALGL